MAVTPNRRMIAVAERGEERGVVNLYDATTLRRRKMLKYDDLGSKEVCVCTSGQSVHETQYGTICARNQICPFMYFSGGLGVVLARLKICNDFGWSSRLDTCSLEYGPGRKGLRPLEKTRSPHTKSQALSLHKARTCSSHPTVHTHVCI